jgi:hypothetical protein
MQHLEGSVVRPSYIQDAQFLKVKCQLFFALYFAQFLFSSQMCFSLSLVQSINQFFSKLDTPYVLFKTSRSDTAVYTITVGQWHSVTSLIFFQLRTPPFKTLLCDLG